MAPVFFWLFSRIKTGKQLCPLKVDIRVQQWKVPSQLFIVCLTITHRQAGSWLLQKPCEVALLPYTSNPWVNFSSKSTRQCLLMRYFVHLSFLENTMKQFLWISKWPHWAQTKCKPTVGHANKEGRLIGVCFICCQTHFSCFTRKYGSFIGLAKKSV